MFNFVSPRCDGDVESDFKFDISKLDEPKYVDTLSAGARQHDYHVLDKD